jgi:hypothetical protein
MSFNIALLPHPPNSYKTLLPILQPITFATELKCLLQNLKYVLSSLLLSYYLHWMLQSRKHGSAFGNTLALYRHRASVGWALAVSSRVAEAEHNNLLTVSAGLLVVGNRHTRMRVGMRMAEGRWRPLKKEGSLRSADTFCVHHIQDQKATSHSLHTQATTVKCQM